MSPTEMPPEVPTVELQRSLPMLADLLAAAHSGRGAVDLWEIMGELRACLAGGDTPAMVRLFRGYCD